MHDITRRGAVSAGAAALLLGLAGCAGEPGPSSILAIATTASQPPTPTPTPRPVPQTVAAPVVVDVPQPVPVVERVPVGEGTITRLPGDGSLLAWTVDDGTDSAVVAAYAAFAAKSGIRLTMFANGCYGSWDDNADALRPLVASGQIQLGNHTWSHADLTQLSDSGIIDELQRNHDYLAETFGVDPRPYFRPPFGYHDDRVDAVAASIGYTVPTLWYGSLSDSGLITEQQIIDLAGQWFQPQHIVIGHLNFPPVTNVFPQLRSILRDRGLVTVTLNDVFTSEYHP